MTFINSYCMFKIMYDNFWVSLNSHIFCLVLFILVLLIVLYFNVLVTIDEMSVWFGFFWIYIV